MVQGKGEAGSQEGVLQPLVEERRVEGGYRVRLQGEFYLAVKDDDLFRLRETILFLRQLEGPTERRPATVGGPGCGRP